MSEEARSYRAPNGTAYDLTGPADAPVVVLIHGLGLCRRLWDAHLPAFATRWRVIRYDLYGHGESTAPSGALTLALYARQIAELLDHLGHARAALVGFSIGGMINRRFAMDFPARVEALAILNSPHDRGDEAQAQVEARAAKVRDEGRMATLEAALERWFTRGFRAARPDVMHQIAAWRAAAEAGSYAQAAWVLANGVRELTQPAVAITAPALVMTSAQDSGSTPEMAHAIAAEIADAETLIVPELRHLGLIEAPETFARPVLDFLERTHA